MYIRRVGKAVIASGYCSIEKNVRVWRRSVIRHARLVIKKKDSRTSKAETSIKSNTVVATRNPGSDVSAHKERERFL